MSIITSPILLGADVGGAYQIQRSLRFNSNDSAYLSRTPGSAGNRKTWTWAGWVKRTVKNTATDQMLFAGGTTNSATGFLALDFNSSDKLRLSSATANILITTAVYRDAAAWAHVLLAFDSTQGTDANKAKLYVNGVEVTAFDTDGRSSISNQDYGINQAAAHEIGRATLGSNKYLDGYLADIHFIDGQALTPSSFTETDATTGQLIPKAFSGSYGTNGFRLSFSDNSGTTSTTLGKDAAGSNNWTPNNFSVSSGSGNDSLVDSPTGYGTDTGAGGEVRGNYCTLNPLVNTSGHSFSNGNLEVVTNSSNYGTFVSTIATPTSGKWYAEAYISATSGYPLVGIAGTGCTFGTTSYLGGQATMYAYYGVNGNKYNNGTSSSYGATYTTGDTLGIAYDADAGTITFYKNGVSQGQAYSGITSGSYYFAGNEFNSASGTQIWNFGQRPFAYTAPSGFKALCTQNLPAPVIAQPSTAMDVKLYTGNGSTQTISGLGFSPDLVWIKRRDSAGNHALFDVIRGTGKFLESSTTGSESTSVNSLTAFNGDGFSLGTETQTNTNSATYCSWNWDAGSSTVTNTQGSITSSVRANASAGFSVVTYTGAGSAGSTVGHGGLVNLTNGMIIIKQRNSASNWWVGHGSQGWTKAFEGLNTTAAISTTSAAWNNTAPSSTVFTLGTETNMNGSGNTYVAYCFAPVTGYSSAFSYSGNGSSDGPMVWLGFRPRFIIQKRTDSAGSWLLIDTARDPVNVARNEMFANSSVAEYDNTSLLDVLSNGFKIRATFANMNASGGTFIGFAFAESPFAYARAR